jgi:hypothetical protein
MGTNKGTKKGKRGNSDYGIVNEKAYKSRRI